MNVVTVKFGKSVNIYVQKMAKMSLFTQIGDNFTWLTLLLAWTFWYHVSLVSGAGYYNLLLLQMWEFTVNNVNETVFEEVECIQRI